MSLAAFELKRCCASRRARGAASLHPLVLSHSDDTNGQGSRSAGVAWAEEAGHV